MRYMLLLASLAGGLLGCSSYAKTIDDAARQSHCAIISRGEKEMFFGAWSAVCSDSTTLYWYPSHEAKEQSLSLSVKWGMPAPQEQGDNWTRGFLLGQR